MRTTPDGMLVAEVDTAVRVTASAIWLHGLGAFAGDLDWVIASLKGARAIGIRFVVPNAPARPITVDEGRLMRGWFDLLSLEEESPEDDAGVRDSEHRLRALIDAERQRGVPAERIVLAGYSQGAAMALHVGLRYPEPLAGVIALSGYLPLPDHLERERHQANARTPILMVHGRDDPVMPIGRARRGRDQLRQAGYDVEWHEYPMGHAICDEEITRIDEWQREVLAGDRETS